MKSIVDTISTLNIDYYVSHIKKMVIFSLLSIACLGILSCNEKDEINFPEYPSYLVIPGLVVVKVKLGYTIKEVFNFINSYDYDVKRMSGRTFVSSLPSDSIKYVEKQLKSKSYLFGEGENWILVYQSANLIYTVPYFHDMSDPEYQADWLQTMQYLKLSEITGIGESFSVIFIVPKGHEKEAITEFENDDIVREAKLYRHYFITNFHSHTD